MICQSLWKPHLKMGVGDISLLPASLGLFSDRPQTPPLNTRDVKTTNAPPQRRSFSVLDASSRRRGESVNAMWPLQCLIKVLTKTHVCFYAPRFAKSGYYIFHFSSREWRDTWVMHPVSPGFERGNKSILALLLTINCTLKFYSVFMICRAWMIYVDGVSHSL